MILASKYKIPVSFVFSLKESNRKYHFYATKGKVFPNIQKPGAKQGNIQKMVEEYVAYLETMVKKYPFQWFNYHDFWEKQG